MLTSGTVRDDSLFLLICHGQAELAPYMKIAAQVASQKCTGAGPEDQYQMIDVQEPRSLVAPSKHSDDSKAIDGTSRATSGTGCSSFVQEPSHGFVPRVHEALASVVGVESGAIRQDRIARLFDLMDQDCVSYVN